MFLLALLFNAKGQQLSLRNFTVSQYGGGTQNWCISQTDDGRMIFANNNGLLVYDGNRWILKSMFNSNDTRAVLYDNRHKRIFIGCTNEFGYYYFDNNTQHEKYRSLSSSLPLGRRDFNEIWNIYQNNNEVIFQSNNDIFIYNDNGGLRDIKIKERITNSALIKGLLFFATKKGIFKYQRNNISELKGARSMANHTIRAILPLGKNILFATSTDGVYVYNGISTSQYAMDISAQLKNNQIFCAATNGRYIAFGTVRDGAIIKNLKTGKTHYVNTYTGLLNNTVLSIKFDKRDNLWLGLDNGISYALLNVPYRNVPGALNNIGTGYASLEYNGNIYLGTNQGLFRISKLEESMSTTDKPRMVIQGQVWQLQNIGGTMFCGTDAGAYIISGSHCSKLNGPDGSWNFHPLKHHHGYILASDYTGFYIIKKDGNNISFSNRIKGFNETSGSFEEDNDGSIWIKHWLKGIYHVTLSNDLSSVNSIRLYCKGHGLHSTECNELCRINGKIYISSLDGVYYYDKSKRQMMRNNLISSLFHPHGKALKLYETLTHDIWAVSNNYLAIAHRFGNHYITDSLSYRSFTNRLQTGMGDIDIIDSSRTLFNCDNGFYLVKNNAVNKPIDDKLIIRSITGTNNKDTLLYSGLLPNNLNEIKIPHSQNSIRIEFAQPEYIDDNAVEYFCYLKGVDKNCGQCQTSTCKEYTHLSKGTYIFHVISLNRLTGKSQEAMIKIKILPAWYETTFISIIYLIIFLVLAHYVCIYINRRCDKKMEAIRKEELLKFKEQEDRRLIEEEKNKCELAELKSQHLKLELRHKASELADTAVKMIHYNDILQALDEEIKNISESIRHNDTKSKVVMKIASVRKEIQKDLNDDDTWNMLESNFNLVYDGFVNRLTSRFPELNVKDRKICAYLRMGLSSKEIASLINSSTRSVETARYRLRKKMELNNGESLTTFLRSI
jgi:DNA-binding CsgD family transcriptional regulator